MQFMDSLSWTLLLEVNRRVRPCFIVLGFRPSAHGHSRGRAQELHAVEGATFVNLGPLAKDEVRALAAMKLNGAEPPEGFWGHVNNAQARLESGERKQRGILPRDGTCLYFNARGGASP